MDLTSAVNVMLWARDEPCGAKGYAVWHIFPANASEMLRKFLREEGKFEGPGDPIHSQTMCMTPSLLRLLETKYSVRPYVIHQFANEAVFIPAGCAHQVFSKQPHCSVHQIDIM